MCHESTDIKNAGISGQAQRFPNSISLGQCSRCLINIPYGHLCGIKDGQLVCGAEVRSAQLTPRTYGLEVLQMLAEYNNETECA